VKPAGTPEVPAEKKSVEDRSFERLAKEAAALRQRGEKYKNYETLETKLPPGSLDALAKAKLANDPEAALVALGWSYADIAERQLGKAAEPEDGEAAKKPAGGGKERPELPPEVASALAAVEELKAERDARNAAASEAEARSKIKEGIKGKFPLVEALERDGKVADYLVDFWKKTGRGPGETFEESVELAAIAVEKDLAKEKEVWRKVFEGEKLDTSGKSPTVGGEAQDASAGAGSPGKTLTNEMSSGGTKPTPKTRAEILKALENDPRAWSSD
jgi:hypothetical protein